MKDENQESILKAILELLVIVGIVLSIYLVFSKTVYDCSNVDNQVVAETLQMCISKEILMEELAHNEEILSKEINLQKDKEKHETCRVALANGIKNCDDVLQNLESFSKITNSKDCSRTVKETLCEPKMFLWKLWYL